MQILQLQMHPTRILAFSLLSAVCAVAKPVLHLDFEGESTGFETVGLLSFGVGPRPPEFPDFAKKNRAGEFDGSGRLVIEDSGKNSPLDFENGDAKAKKPGSYYDAIENAVSLPDFHATVHAALGIDPTKELHANDRPVPITDGGKPIASLFA